MSNPAKEFVRVRSLDTGHHFTVTRLVANRSERLIILDDHDALDKDGRVQAAKPRRNLAGPARLSNGEHVVNARATASTKRTSRTKPEPTPDVSEPNAEDPARKAE